MTERWYGPRIGEWYKNERGVSFEIITVDGEEQLIEIQYFDGRVEELDFDGWRRAEFTSREPPEELSGLYDEPGMDDLGERLHPSVWSGPLDGMDWETEWGD